MKFIVFWYEMENVYVETSVISYFGPGYSLPSAFVLSVAIAFPLGTISGQVPSVEKMLHPLFGFTRYLPVASLVPLCIL